MAGQSLLGHARRQRSCAASQAATFSSRGRIPCAAWNARVVACPGERVDPANSDAWDLGVRRFGIANNGGIFGGGMEAVMLEACPSKT